MNLLFLCDEYPPGRHGGIGTSVQLLARALVRQGHKVVVAGFCDWGYGGQDREEDEGVLVYRFRRFLHTGLLTRRDALPVRAAYKLFTLSGIYQQDIGASLKRYGQFLENLIREHRIDLAEMPDYNEYINYIRKFTPFPRLSVPVVVKLHGSITYFKKEEGTEVPEYILQTERQILSGAAAVTSVSHYTARKTKAYFSYEGPVTVLYNGITLPAAMPDDQNRERGLVLFTGSLLEKKGIYQLMKAWNIVHKAIPGAVLMVYGKGPAGRIETLLSEDAKPGVHFMGHVGRDELMHRLSAAEIAVFPSFAECFALAPMEAMACGAAVIYTKRTSGPELIRDGTDGLLADPGNVEDLAGKIIKLLGDEPLRHMLSGNGRERVASCFSIDLVASQHAAFYEDLLRMKGIKANERA